MSIKVGDMLPRMKMMMVDGDGSHEMATEELFRDRLMVLFAVPGAFTPTCSVKHLPEYLQHRDSFTEKGVDLVCCLAVNDAFVLSAWAADQKIGGRIVLLADGSAQFTREMGLELDLTARGMGVRSQRYGLIAKNGRLTYLAVEPPGGFEASRAQAMLAHL